MIYEASCFKCSLSIKVNIGEDDNPDRGLYNEGWEYIRHKGFACPLCLKEINKTDE